MTMPRGECQFVHLQRRSWDRFAVAMTREIHDEMAWQICRGTAAWLHDQDGGRSMWVVAWPRAAGPAAAGMDVRAVYDSQTEQIVTLLAMNSQAVEARAAARARDRAQDRGRGRNDR
jgi:hypothetical protein